MTGNTYLEYLGLDVYSASIFSRIFHSLASREMAASRFPCSTFFGSFLVTTVSTSLLLLVLTSLLGSTSLLLDIYYNSTNSSGVAINSPISIIPVLLAVLCGESCKDTCRLLKALLLGSFELSLK